MSLGLGSLLLKFDGRVRSNFAWFLSDRVGRVLISVVVGIAVARHLGPKDFGILSFATALVGFFAISAALGLDEILMRDLVDGPKAGATWRVALRLRLFASLLAFLAVMGAACVLRPGEPRVWLITAIVASGLIFTPVELVDVWFQARSMVRPPAMARQLVLWSAGGVRLLLIAGHAPLIAFAWAMVAEAAVVAGVLGWLFRREMWRPKEVPGVETRGRELLREGWPMLVSGFLVIVTMQSDRLLLGRYAGDAAVGIYAVAVRFTEVLHALPLALGTAVMPQLVALHRTGDGASYWGMARRIFVVGLIAALGCASVLSYFAPRIVVMVFGQGYSESASVLSVHVWTFVFVMLVSLRSRLLVIEAGTHWVLIISLLTAVLNVTCNLVLIPRFSCIGAAWAAAGAWAFSALVAPFFFPVTRRLMWHVLQGRGPVLMPMK